MAKAPAGEGKAAGTGKANSAFMKPLQPSEALAKVVGSDPLPRSEAVSKMWDYIRKHNLQNPANKREIIADAEHVIFDSTTTPHYHFYDAETGTVTDVPAGGRWGGAPAMPMRELFRRLVELDKLAARAVEGKSKRAAAGEPPASAED